MCQTSKIYLPYNLMFYDKINFECFTPRVTMHGRLNIKHITFHLQKNPNNKIFHLVVVKSKFIFFHVIHFRAVGQYRGADKSLVRPASRCVLFDVENISFDASLVIYINSTNIPPIMIINRIYEHKNLLSLQLVSFLVGLRIYQHPLIPFIKQTPAQRIVGDINMLRLL